MTFPRSNRFRYLKSPLVEVICQLRFPAILKIDSESPVQFQEAIRASFPGYLRTDVTPFAIVAGGVKKLLPDTDPNPDRRVEHSFLDAGGTTKVTLGRDFIALSSSAYLGWEAFFAQFSRVVAPLVTAYQPDQCVRAGLRYQNVIRRSKLALDNRPWSELLRLSVAGLLGEASPMPVYAVTEAIYELGPPRVCRLVHGTVKAEDETSYLIDSDFFQESAMPIERALNELGQLHEEAGWAFRWCISEPLHLAMQPEALT